MSSNARTGQGFSSEVALPARAEEVATGLEAAVQPAGGVFQVSPAPRPRPAPAGVIAA